MANLVRVAIVGVGNCASSLIQGVHFYRTTGSQNGLLYSSIGKYAVSDVRVVAAFDVDSRKVGQDVNQAIYAEPNCTKRISSSLPASGVVVKMGRVEDGVSVHMRDSGARRGFDVASVPQPNVNEVVEVLKSTGAEVLVNYLPVGSQAATEFYVECALSANVAVVNAVPVFIASNKSWADRFKKLGVPLIGDDVKSQLGATALHRSIVELCGRRGVVVDHSYQLNVGGNSDFANMLDRTRLLSKKQSKTEAVVSAIAGEISQDQIHVGPSDYVHWLADNKVCFIRVEGRGFAEVPFEIEVRLSVEDSPNSAAVVLAAVRCCKLALDRKIGGVLGAASACFCKKPPLQLSESDAFEQLAAFLAD